MAQAPRKKSDDSLVLSLASGLTVAAAARQCRLSTRTIYRRLADESFRRRLQEVRADMVQRAAGALSAAATKAVRTLVALQEPSVPPPVRLGAARAVLEIGARLREATELEERLAALEAQLGSAVAG
jgi:hypothetical protein